MTDVVYMRVSVLRGDDFEALEHAVARDRARSRDRRGWIMFFVGVAAVVIGAIGVPLMLPLPWPSPPPVRREPLGRCVCQTEEPLGTCSIAIDHDGAVHVKAEPANSTVRFWCER